MQNVPTIRRGVPKDVTTWLVNAGRPVPTDYYDGIPSIDDDLAIRLRETGRPGNTTREQYEVEASKQIAAACLALRQKFAVVSGGKWQSMTEYEQ